MERSAFVNGLEPKAYFECFYDLSMVPRVPGKQRQVSDFLVAYAKGLGLPCVQDKALNVIVRKPASPGYENAPSVMLQAHMDMVCEKNPDVAHDFEKDPLRLLRDGDVISADGTTLGADDGMGVAYIMALLADTKAKHPAIEAVFTTDEETDMGGAFGLDYSRIKSRLIINLDAQDVTVCGSGELEVEMTLDARHAPVATDALQYALEISGLKGGHTGLHAMAERGNGLVLLNRVLLALDKKAGYQLVSMNGGAGMSSAFAREARAVIAFAASDLPVVQETVAKEAAVFRKELLHRDPQVKLDLQAYPEKKAQALAPQTALTLKRLLAILPDGVFSLNREFPGSMESCSNTGVVETREKEIFITTLIRSCTAAKKYYLYDKITMLCDTLGVRHRIGRDLPHWEYSVSDSLAAILAKVYPDRKPEVTQATTEGGVFCGKLPGVSVIGLRPKVYDNHSPSEHFLISEAQKGWTRLLETLALLR